MSGDFVRCSQCSKKVSTTFENCGRFVLRAWVECPECIESNDSIKLERQAIGEWLKKRENAYTTGGWKPVVFGDEIEALLRGERPEAVG